jgi:hypothetical protein
MKKILIIILKLLISSFLYSENCDYIQWHNSITKISENTYAITLQAKIPEAYYIFSMEQKGGPFPLSISFEPYGEIVILKNFKDAGNVKSKYDDVLRMDIEYYETSAVFYAVIQINENIGSVSMNIVGQACYGGVCELISETIVIELK